jgi:hypothetical protein
MWEERTCKENRSVFESKRYIQSALALYTKNEMKQNETHPAPVPESPNTSVRACIFWSSSRFSGSTFVFPFTSILSRVNQRRLRPFVTSANKCVHGGGETDVAGARAKAARRDAYSCNRCDLLRRPSPGPRAEPFCKIILISTRNR